MKTYAYHDENGSIKSIVSFTAPDGHGLLLAASPGVFISKIEKVQFKSDTPTFEELSELAREHRIANPVISATVVKK